MSWVGRIATTSINNVNNEVGYSGTATTQFNDTRVRRLANKITGGATIAMSDMRFGIQVPLVSYTDSFFANTAALNATDANFGFAEAYVEIDLNSTGSGSYFTYTSSGGLVSAKSFTWLNIGSAGDYDCQFSVESGNAPNEGDSVNTQLSLSTSRFWRWRVTRSTVGVNTRNGTGTLYIYRSGVIGPFRRFDIVSYAERF